MDPGSGTPIIILKDINSEVLLPIWVGGAEANAIALEIEKVSTQRPMTHDLLRNFVEELGASVTRVVITDLKDNTFFAVIEINSSDGRALSLDSRPSDAIALALRVDCPIYVDDEVIRISKNVMINKEETSETAESEDWPDVIGEAGDLPM